MLLKFGESGNIEFMEVFEKDYMNVKFILRGVVYYYVVFNGNDINRFEFYFEFYMDIIGYIFVVELDKVQEGDNLIRGQVSVLKDFFDLYI